MKTVTLYTRRNCGLCEEARQTLEQMLPQSCELQYVDIERDLSREDPRRLRYGLDAPVVELDGQVVFRNEVDPAALERLLAQDLGRG